MQRAQRILEDSIAFRTSVIPEIHKEIHEASWDGWHRFRTECMVNGHKRDAEQRHMLVVSDGHGFVSISPGSKRYIGSLR